MTIQGVKIKQNPWGPKVGTPQFPSATPTLPTQVDVDKYESGAPGYSYGYDVKQLANTGSLMNQSFDPYRQNAMRDVNAGVQSNLQTGMTSLASSGGLSEADRQALGAQQQRARVSGQQGSQGLYDQMQAQNAYDTQKYNVGQEQGVLDYNQQILNNRARDMSMEASSKAENLYNQGIKDSILDRQLEASKIIAGAQTGDALEDQKRKAAEKKALDKNSVGRQVLDAADKIYDPFDVFKNPTDKIRW